MLKPFIYAETAFHHQGDLSYLMKLIDKAAEAGMDGIKFQVLIKFNNLISHYNPAFEKLEEYVFSLGQWREIFNHAVSLGLSIIMMPLDIDSFSLTHEFNSHIKFIELHSVSFNDFEIRNKIKESKIDLILGVGGRTKAEMKDAIGDFGSQLKVLMTGFQSFPSVMEDIRLRRIKDLKGDFPDLHIGYADHCNFDDTWGVESYTLAYALGATIFEKHLTLQQGEKRIDYESAVGFEILKEIKANLESAYHVLFNYPDSYEMSEAETIYRNRQKMVVATRKLQPNEVISKNDIALKMIGRFDGFSRVDEVIGKTLRNPVSADFLIKKEDVNS